jgi:tetratricopeptide (TPR) repeat protein
MRIRILAYQALGELEQAAAIIPQYLKQDPQNAGATLQGLLNTFKDEIAQAEDSGQTEQAQRKAEDALIVARALHTWSEQSTAGLDETGRLAFKLEYGEALLRTGRAGEALKLFRSVVDAGRGSKNGRAVVGLAQAYLLDDNPREALPHFSRLYRDTPEDTDLWWRSFLGEIRCRIALDQDRRTLYNLISQKRVFHPQMGGPKRREQFEQLRTELSGES